MKLFIFEPHEWAYCGGAIGVVANTFEEAVNFIVEDDRQRYLKEKKRIEEKWKNTDKRWRPIASRTYRKKHFAKSPSEFKEGIKWDQWLLTNTFNVPEETEAKVAFDNWNYA